MSEKIPSVEVTAPPGIRSPASRGWRDHIQAADSRVLCIAIFLISVGVMLLWRLFRQAEGGDAAIWDYIAQGILRGEVPYRDVIEIKGPASAYLSAMAMWLGEFAGVRDVLAVRFMQIVLAGVLSVVTFLVAEIYLRQRFASLLGLLFPLTSDHFVSWTEGGTQPKLTMILFGMLTLLLIARDRPFWAGVCSMLSCLSWQPGLLFTGVAVLIFSRYLTAWRDRRALKVLAGAVLPLGIVGLYFYWAGALSDLWVWTVAYNFSVYAPEGIRSPGETLTHAWTVLVRVFKLDIIWFALGLAGLLIFSARHLRAKLKLTQALKSADLFKDAILIAPAVYIAFCLINLQSGPDLIPLFPFFGIFAAWLITEISAWLRAMRAVTKRPDLLPAVEALPVLALLLVFVLTLVRSATYRMEGWTLGHQDTQLNLISDLVGPDDKIYVHGAVEILLLLKRPNMNPYIMWDHGKARYVAARKYGGSIDAMVDAIEAARPKLVAVSRLRHVPEGAALERWLEQHYERLPIPGYDAYLRKQ
jgi:hypothetical protein